MFGMGFFEILLVAIIAIIALGPDKLPGAMVDIAKFLKKFKSGVEDAKSSLDNELNISEMKAEANKFKAQIEDAKSTVSIPDMDLGLNSILKDDLLNDEDKESKNTKDKTIENNNEEKVKKTSSEKINKTSKKESREEVKEIKKETSSSDKFKVVQEEQDK